MHRVDSTRATEARLFRADAGEVQSIRIQKSDTEDILLEKEGQEWWLREPVQWPANPFAVQRTLNQLLFIERELSFPVDSLEDSGRSLEDYGLENPQMSLSVRTARRQMQMAIGAQSGLGNRLYVLTDEGTEVSVVGKDAFEGFQVGVDELRSDQVFDLPIYAVESIVIKIREPDLTIRLARNGDQWVFESPITTIADSERVNALLNELTHLKVSTFIGSGGNLASTATGLDSPAMRVSLRGKNRHQTLLLGSRKSVEGSLDKNFAMIELLPTTFTVLSEPFEKIRTHWEQLREHRILSHQMQEVSGITIARAGKRLSIQRLETGPWQIVSESPDGGLMTLPADTDAVLGLLAHLTTLQASTFVSDAPSEGDLERYGLQPPQGEITLRGAKTLSILIGGELSEAGRPMRYLSTSEVQSVYGVEDAALELIEAEPYAYRSRQLLSLPTAARFERLALTEIFPDGSEGAALSLSANDEDQELWNALGEMLSQFEAKAFIPGEVSASAVLTRGAEKSIPWQYRLDVVVRLPGADANQTRTYSFFISKLENLTTSLAADSDMRYPFVLRESDARILARWANQLSESKLEVSVVPAQE